MDNDLKQKFAPRRDKRHAHAPSLAEAEVWAGSLDWKTNDYDFFRLCQSVFDYLDWRYRGEAGFRLDQFVSLNDLMMEARRSVELYQDLHLADCIGIYHFLYASLDVWIGGLANLALNRRLEAGQDIAG